MIQIRSEIGLSSSLNREGVLVEWFQCEKGTPFFEVSDWYDVCLMFAESPAMH